MMQWELTSSFWSRPLCKWRFVCFVGACAWLCVRGKRAIGVNKIWLLLWKIDFLQTSIFKPFFSSVFFLVFINRRHVPIPFLVLSIKLQVFKVSLYWQFQVVGGKETIYSSWGKVCTMKNISVLAIITYHCKALLNKTIQQNFVVCCQSLLPIVIISYNSFRQT